MDNKCTKFAFGLTIINVIVTIINLFIMKK